MKFNASAQNAFSLNSALPLVGQWEQGAVRRPRFKIKPFAFEGNRPTLAQQDELARKQEMICAVILGLCLLSTLLLCVTQLRPQ